MKPMEVNYTEQQLQSVAAFMQPRHVSLLRLALDKLPYKIMAEKLGLKLGTVKSSLNRARRSLAKQLESQTA